MTSCVRDTSWCASGGRIGGGRLLKLIDQKLRLSKKIT